jgi:ubiquinone/menaquinone biosynthesis C-methylase UbiE
MPKDDLRQTYNHIARDYVKDHRLDTWDDDYIQYFVDALKKGAKVLDLGCGPGVDSAKLVNKGLQVDGFDLSDELLVIAKELNPDQTFTQGDMRKLPYSKDSFDGVFAKASLLHIPKKDIPSVLDEVWRVLKLNGTIHFALKAGDGENVITEDDYGYEYSRYFSFWNINDFVSQLEKHKFSIFKAETSKKSRTGHTLWIKIIANKIESGGTYGK